MESQRHVQNKASVTTVPVVNTVRRKPLPTTLPDKAEHVPQGWPSAPSPIKTSLSSIIWEAIVDIVLLALSLLFLVFTLIINHYDGAPTAQHPQATSRLLSATKFVRYPAKFAY